MLWDPGLPEVAEQGGGAGFDSLAELIKRKCGPTMFEASRGYNRSCHHSVMKIGKNLRGYRIGGYGSAELGFQAGYVFGHDGYR
jgi:hypothetical protein